MIYCLQRIVPQSIIHNRRFLYGCARWSNWPYHKTNSGFLAPQGTAFERQTNNDLIVRVGEQSCHVPARLLENRDCPIDAISAYIEHGRCYLALPAARCSPYRLLHIDPHLGKNVWTTEVWAAGGLLSYTGLGYHWVTLTAKEDALLVFGLGDDAAYIEAFDPHDGTNLFRFSTAY